MFNPPHGTTEAVKTLIATFDVALKMRESINS